MRWYKVRGSSEHAETDGCAAGEAGGGRLKAVKLEEEAALLRFYAGKAQAMCRAFHFPSKVAPVALAYLQRFFAQASVLDHHPRDVMLAAVYVACKVTAGVTCPPVTMVIRTCLNSPPHSGVCSRACGSNTLSCISCTDNRHKVGRRAI